MRKPGAGRRNWIASVDSSAHSKVSYASNGLGGEPLTGRMTYSAQWELDSAWIVARYEQTIMGRSTSGLLMYSWDAASSRYLFYGFPNTPMQPNRLRGRFEDGAFVFESDSGSGVMGVRETWQVVGRDTIVTAISGRRGSEWVSGPRTVLVRVPK